MSLIVHLLPCSAAPHLINIIIILIMLWVSFGGSRELMVPIKREIRWHLEVRKRKRDGGGRGGGRESCARLLRAAGGAWQWERARPGGDHRDPADGNFYSVCQAHLCILLSSYRCGAVLLLRIHLSRVALLPQCFMVRLSVLSRL